MRLRPTTLGALLALVAAVVVVVLGPKIRGGERGIASIPAGAVSDLKAIYKRPGTIPYPAHNPFSSSKYRLGKTLFFDPRLSRSNQVACATCHNPGLSWSDGLPKGVGFGHKTLGRRVPTILNAAWGSTFFWDGRAGSMEEQALGPIQSPAEMNLPIAEAIARLRSIDEYGDLFERAFPGEGITAETLAKAIATFERGVVSDVAPFDQWIEGDEGAISEGAKRGFAVFNTKGACVTCHTGWNFTNGSFADTGLPSDDLGRGKIEANRYLNHTFKTPTLRNIASRGPYMHDGSLVTLRAVVEHYDSGGTAHRETSQLFMKPLHLSEQEKQDLLAFLETLTSRDEAVIVPQLPRAQWKETP